MANVSVLMPFKITLPEQVGWLIEAIKSIRDQEYQEWELVLVNDHSTQDLSAVKTYLQALDDSRILGYKLPKDKTGVCQARNLAAEKAGAELLLPVDADDRLVPEALKKYMIAWANGGNAQGLVYTDVQIFGQDFQRLFSSGDYDFTRLLQNLFMCIGGLHRKSDWQRAGGWNPVMEAGLEDWEYWIHLGELGVCGYYIPDALYQYRKVLHGRYATLRAGGDLYDVQSAKIRDLHANTYKGERPMGCCGRGSTKNAPARQPATIAYNVPAGDRVAVYYVGNRSGSFFMTGKMTGTKYMVNGAGNMLTTMDSQLGVFKEDVTMLTAINRGRDFVVK